MLAHFIVLENGLKIHVHAGHTGEYSDFASVVIYSQLIKYHQ